MSIINNNFFVIDYFPDGAGRPYSMDKVWSPELPGYDIYTAPPNLDDFSDRYSVRIKTFKLDGDYFPDDNLISGEMFNLVNDLSVRFISFPVAIDIHRGRVPSKAYYLFYLTNYLSLMDGAGSVYTISRDLDSGRLNTPEDRCLDKVYYEKIDFFKTRDDVSDNLFFCKEISKPVCSVFFKEEFEARGLSGVTFIPIDDSYRYDPWSNFCS
ncbi:imm11 family protein [Metapseudomonas otitidis]|uniref:imm11 family protein n=1 Tax=Metapseudomonas otitidis TaxID=319939 RepID=UPI0013F66AF5|nr:hypothetical protein [Pseudomonas otitidis]